ncbi:hypothetical protein BC826DRAFT_970477 [Russula brevipes]|nr:hypothetical protein BC826DRAFT_970477 [Russula brevipes]
MGSSWPPYENPVPRYQFCAARDSDSLYLLLVSHNSHHLAPRISSTKCESTARRCTHGSAVLAFTAAPIDRRKDGQGSLGMGMHVPRADGLLRTFSVRHELRFSAASMWAWHRFLLLDLMWPGRKPTPTPGRILVDRGGGEEAEEEEDEEEDEEEEDEERERRREARGDARGGERGARRHWTGRTEKECARRRGAKRVTRERRVVRGGTKHRVTIQEGSKPQTTSKSKVIGERDSEFSLENEVLKLS